MRQAAHYDLHTTEGLAQVQHLRFVLPSGEVDTQFNGMTIRGGVLDDGIREMPGSEIIDGRCALQLPRLAAGCHRYDVLVSGYGTDKPLLAGVIHVAPRVTPVDVDDNAPADYLDIVIPADEGGTITVISESPAWVDDAVEKSLQERGMYVTPVDGGTVLTMSAGTSTRDFNYFTFALNSTYVSGHLAGSYRLNKIALQTPASEANGTRWMARLCRYSAGLALPLEVLGTSTSTAAWSSINATTMECHWNFNGIAVSAADRLILEVYAVDASGAPVSKALIAYGAAAAHGGTEGVLIASGDKLAWRNYSRLALTMSVAYDDGVSVGGIELASRRHFDALAANVAETGRQIADDADAAQQAKEEAEQIVSGMTLTAGTITTGAPGSQAVAELKPGSTAGSYTLDMTIPRGDVGTVDISQAYTWTHPQTYDATINANGGINLVSSLAAGMPKAAMNAGAAAVLEVLGNVYHIDHINGSSVTTLEGSNVKIERALTGWCGLSWTGTNTAHKCILVKASIANGNYGGAIGPMWSSNYALVMSLLSGVNMATTSTKFGWTGYWKTIDATNIEDIPGPSFYVDCEKKKVVAKNAAGDITELPWAGLSMDVVSRLDLIVVPSSYVTCKVYLARHVGAASGEGSNFNRRHLTPQVHYLGEVPIGLVGNDCNYTLVDTCSSQMALFRVSVFQGINPADYLNVENI